MRVIDQRGSSLITAMVVVALISALLSAYYVKTMYEVASTKNTMNATRGFYAAEAGLNIRAEEIRQLFVASTRPTGTTPVPAAGQIPCHTGDQGAGHFVCKPQTMEGRKVYTYVEETPGNPMPIVIPPGVPFQNLNASEYDFNVVSVAVNDASKPEAILKLNFKSRVVPLFQFAIFYAKDLEITPGPPLTLSGPVHANGDIYAAASSTVDIQGDMTTSDRLFRGRKDSNTCSSGPFRVLDPVNPTDLPACSSGRRLITNANLTPWNGHVTTGVTPVQVPTPDDLDPVAGKLYWDNADIRVMMNATSNAITVRNVDGSIHTANPSLASCTSGTLGNSTSFFNNREGKFIDMMDVHMEQFITCLGNNGDLIDGKTIDDATNGGLVFYFGVEGPASAGINDYGVRLTNGTQLRSTGVGDPPIEGLTVISGQSVYVQGDYNNVNKKPAAVLADSINVLSQAWTNDNISTQPMTNRVAAITEIYAAFLTGTDTTGGVDGDGGQGGQYSGGVHNLKRMHEDWRTVRLTYRGSLVSLNMPQHVNGVWTHGASSSQYWAPDRDFNYDTDFNNADNLPPLTPTFVYTRQQLFVRDFEF